MRVSLTFLHAHEQSRNQTRPVPRSDQNPAHPRTWSRLNLRSEAKPDQKIGSAQKPDQNPKPDQAWKPDQTKTQTRQDATPGKKASPEHEVRLVKKTDQTRTRTD